MSIRINSIKLSGTCSSAEGAKQTGNPICGKVQNRRSSPGLSKCIEAYCHIEHYRSFKQFKPTEGQKDRRRPGEGGRRKTTRPGGETCPPASGCYATRACDSLFRSLNRQDLQSGGLRRVAFGSFPATSGQCHHSRNLGKLVLEPAWLGRHPRAHPAPP